VIAARHDYDFKSGRRDVPGQAVDEELEVDVPAPVEEIDTDALASALGQ
jgi:hypothetical protein